MSKIEIGKIVNTHGLKGTLKVQPWVDYPEIFEELDVVFILDKKYNIKSVGYHKSSVLLDLKEITDLTEAEKFKDLILYASREDLGDLPQNSYYIADLIGCKIIVDGVEIGVVSDVITSSGTDLYEIKRNGDKPIYLPAAKEFVKSVDVANKAICAVLPEGLLEI